MEEEAFAWLEDEGYLQNWLEGKRSMKMKGACECRFEEDKNSEANGREVQWQEMDEEKRYVSNV